MGLDVLTDKHLMALRAAISFWKDEMPAADRKTWQVYAGVNASDSIPTQSDIDWLHENLPFLRLRYSVRDAGLNRWDDDRLFDTPEELERSGVRGEMTAVLILEKQDGS